MKRMEKWNKITRTIKNHESNSKSEKDMAQASHVESYQISLAKLSPSQYQIIYYARFLGSPTGSGSLSAPSAALEISVAALERPAQQIDAFTFLLLEDLNTKLLNYAFPLVFKTY